MYIQIIEKNLEKRGGILHGPVHKHLWIDVDVHQLKRLTKYKYKGRHFTWVSF